MFLCLKDVYSEVAKIFIYTVAEGRAKELVDYMAIPEITNIPVLGTLPNIPKLYASTPNLSFIVDMILLSVVFGSLLAPLGHLIVKDPKLGKRFGAVLGLIFGVASAFALHNAGVTLFTYWLTSVAVAAVISVVIYKIMRALGAGKGFSAAICIALAWFFVYLWFVEAGAAGERTIAAFTLATFIILLLLPIALIWALFHIFGTGATKDFFGNIVRGGGKGLGGLLGKVFRVGKPSAVQEAPAPVVATLPGMEEQLGRDFDNANEITSAAEQQASQTASGSQQAAGQAQQAQGAAAGAIAAASQGNVEEFRTQIENLLARILRIQKQMELQKGTVTRLLAYEAKINNVISQYNTDIRNVQTISAAIITQMQSKVNGSKNAQAKAELLPRLEILKRDIATMEKSLGILNQIAGRMQSHIAFLRFDELKRLSDTTGYVIAMLAGIVKGVNARKDALNTKEELQKMSADIQEKLREVGTHLSATTQQYLQIVELSIRQTAQIKEVKKDINHWKTLFSKTTRLALRSIPKEMETLNSAIEQLEATGGTPPARPERPRPPLARPRDVT